MKSIETVVANIRRETHDAVSIDLFAFDSSDYKAGQFLTIDPRQFYPLSNWVLLAEALRGKREPVRAYSLASEPSETFLTITIKREEYTEHDAKAKSIPPMLSPLLVGDKNGSRLKIREPIIIKGFTGPYVLPDDLLGVKTIYHVVAGSGSVPNFSIMKYALREHPWIKHVMIYSNKTSADIIFRRELDQLQQQHANNVSIVHTLTREHAAGCWQGRISLDLFKECVQDHDGLFYVCGPGINPRDTTKQPRFLETAVDLLYQLGITKQQIKTEKYG